MANAVSTDVLVHPFTGLSITAQTRISRPHADRSAPTTSTRSPLPVARLCGTTRRARTRARATSGTFHPESRAPGPPLDQHPSDDRPHHAAQAERGRPQGDGPAPKGGFGEEVADDRQSGGHQQCRSRPHAAAGSDHRSRRRGECSEYRGRAAHRQATDERAAAANPVRGGTGGQHGAAEDQGVRVDDPLHLGHRGSQLALQVGDGDVEDGQIHAQEEQAQADDCGGRPALAGPARVAVAPVVTDHRTAICRSLVSCRTRAGAFSCG